MGIFEHLLVCFFEETDCFGFVGGSAVFESGAEDFGFVEEDFAVDCPGSEEFEGFSVQSSNLPYRIVTYWKVQEVV